MKKLFFAVILGLPCWLILTSMVIIGVFVSLWMYLASTLGVDLTVGNVSIKNSTKRLSKKKRTPKHPTDKDG